ncbi:MAG: hypothetical protein KC468_27645, partial [Myxococcales bacterium]|nr:hypothetical protein [Myxococcales bacterium]
GDLCGDGEVTGDEVCDDGVNDGGYNGCAADCLALGPYCGDAQVNGPEACDDANNALNDGCFDDCTIPETCADILAYSDAAPDGEYLLKPAAYDGDPFPAYCDMAGGGWTLAMRFAPTNSQFHFYSTHWTQESLVGENELAPEHPSDGKFWAFDFVPGDELRGCLKHPMTEEYGCKAYPLGQEYTPRSLFTTVEVGSDINNKALYFNETQAEKLEWLTIQGRTLAQASVPNPQYVEVGVNIDDDISCYDARVRFGLVLNNENNINTLNDAAGFGAQAYYTAACDIPNGQDSPWATACGFAAGANIYQVPGTIWIR